MIANLTIS